MLANLHHELYKRPGQELVIISKSVLRIRGVALSLGTCLQSENPQDMSRDSRLGPEERWTPKTCTMNFCLRFHGRNMVHDRTMS